MQKEIEAEEKRDAELTEKFVCYCKTNQDGLAASTEELRNEIPQIEAEIEATAGLKAQLAQELAEHKSARADAKSTIEGATKRRETEAAEFAKESADLKANIAASGKAIDALRKGMSGAFLQSDAAGVLRNVLLQRSFDRYSQSLLTEFLSSSTQYAPASGEIVGIISQLKEDMEKELKEATDAENSAIAQFDGLVAAKEKEIAVATQAIESKTERAGKAAVQAVNLKNDLEDAKESLAEDLAFLADLKENCATKASEYDERKKMRAEEQLALSETIKVLNDDDALDLFKKTLASPSSFLQVTNERETRERAVALLSEAGNQPQLSFITLALQGKKAGFEKVLKMIDNMVATLDQEQKDDDAHKEWCGAEFDSSEDQEKETERTIATLETQIGEAEEAIATLTQEITALETGIKELDTAVAEATAQRKSENQNFVSTAASNNAALQLLEVAKNRLNKFYNPALYKPPPERELTEEERIYLASGGVLTTQAPGGIAGTGVALPAFVQVAAKDAPAPPPETVDAYAKRDSSGPIALIDSLKRDLEKDMQQNEHDEKTAQKEYERTMADSAQKRKMDSKSITEKQDQKAGLEADLMAAKDAKKMNAADLLATREYISQLHGSCDFLLQNFGLRKEARASEVDALKKAKAVLSGADYSLLQTRTSAFLRRAAA